MSPRGCSHQTAGRNSASSDWGRSAASQLAANALAARSVTLRPNAPGNLVMKTLFRFTSSCAVMLSVTAARVLLLTAGVHAQWLQFRGSDGTGLSNSKGLPLTWSEKEHVAWKTAIHGRAWSSPVILDDQVWLTTATQDGKAAVCASPSIATAARSSTTSNCSTSRRRSSRTASTPTRRRRRSPKPGRVCVTFGSPGTACLDHQERQGAVGRGAIWSAITTAAPGRRRSSSATC